MHPCRQQAGCPSEAPKGVVSAGGLAAGVGARVEPREAEQAEGRRAEVTQGGTQGWRQTSNWEDRHTAVPPTQGQRYEGGRGSQPFG